LTQDSRYLREEVIQSYLTRKQGIEPGHSSPKLSKLAGVEEEIFRGGKPSIELETVRKEWTREFEERVRKA
jgi:hypothetical protein